MENNPNKLQDLRPIPTPMPSKKLNWFIGIGFLIIITFLLGRLSNQPNLKSNFWAKLKKIDLKQMPASEITKDQSVTVKLENLNVTTQIIDYPTTIFTLNSI